MRNSELENYRDTINDIDDRILSLLQKRAEISKQVGAFKTESGALNVYVPHRHREVIERLKARNQSHGGHVTFSDAAVEAVWTEILSASRALQAPERVAFLGPVGSFGHIASLCHFGSSVELVPVQPQADIFTEVEAGRADFGVVAIANSAQGTVRDVLERFQRTPLKICAEIYQPVKQHLLSRAPLSEIEKIYSHRQPFAQCRIWLNRFMKATEQIEVVSTSVAAQRAAAEPKAGAIASELASDIYQVPVVADSIMDEPNNTTRFFVIGECDAQPSSADRTSLFFAVRDKVGALHQVLGILKRHELNMSYLQSLPSRSEPWEYIFFVEMDGHVAEPNVRTALEQLKDLCQSVKILGSYPRGSFE